VLTFTLSGTSGVAIYLQLVQQVKRALRLGLLQRGDQLPSVREVVAALAINPNTVLKAYRELEREGLIRSRAGHGTFVERTLDDGSLASHPGLRRDLARWLRRARQAGLDRESITALFSATLDELDDEEGVA
jgi:GntR family transcriptional regulator